MADAMKELLSRKQFEEPPEVRTIKTFVRDNFQEDAAITIKPTQIIIGVKGSALAGALRPRLHELQALCQTDKQLVIRIG